MNHLYEKVYSLTDRDTDAFGRVRPSAILSMAQDIAGEHAATLSGSWQELHNQHLFWAVSRHRVQILQMPVLGQTLHLRTWPMPTTRVAYPRAVEAYDETGCLLFRMVSLWVLMDTRTRTLVLPGRGGLTINGICRSGELEIPSSLPQGTFAHTASRQVVYSELDRNLHMNNTRYLDWIDDLLPGAYHQAHPVCEFTACYLTEAREGQTIDLSWELGDQGVLCLDARRKEDPVSAKNERVFAARVRYL